MAGNIIYTNPIKLTVVVVLGVSGGAVGHGLGYLRPLQRTLITRLRLALGVPRPEQEKRRAQHIACGPAPVSLGARNTPGIRAVAH